MNTQINKPKIQVVVNFLSHAFLLFYARVENIFMGYF